MKWRVGNGATRGAHEGLVTLVMGRWEAWGGSQVGLGLEKKSDLIPLGLAKYRWDRFSLGNWWANKCMTLIM